MNGPPKKSPLFWIILATAGGCLGCSMLSAALLFLGLFTTDSVSAPVSVSAAPSAGTLPTGETPDLYPGSPGWLPSGRGVEIPAAEVIDDKPVGLWWTFQTQMDGTGRAGLILFLADGTRATGPRMGGGGLFDREGHRAQRGTTGLGTFEVADGIITQHYDGFTSTDPLTFGDDDGGPWLSIGAARYWPLSPPSEESLVGTWKSAGGKYVFRADGTFESGHITSAGDLIAAVGGQGTWQLDGYLIAIRPNGAPGWISTIGATGNRFLVLGNSVYDRQ